ncbi:MAG: 30S ribosomal protein S20 [Actinomycetes bacterium]|nr:30S ribosomal protein S20 [Actinomycetes bacterium]
MANIKSQKKRNITNEKARLRNKSVKSALKTQAKKVYAAIDAGDAELALREAQTASKQLDIAASKGIIHKNQAANRKSGLMKAANTLTATPAAADAADAEAAAE